MHSFTILLFVTLIMSTVCRGGGGGARSAALTESMGQEVIEIGAPVKELPQDVDEEPSAENDVDNDAAGASAAAAAAAAAASAALGKKDAKKLPGETRRRIKDADRISGKKGEDDEARIEKELADVYKDTEDYKSDEDDNTGDNKATTGAAIKKLKDSFNFSPDDLNDRRAVERFKTSIDDISCGKLKEKTNGSPAAAAAALASSLLVGLLASLLV